MEAVVDKIVTHLEEKGVLFVFPSEVVASFWREKSLTLGSKRGVRSDRFLSWDRFKESLFSLTRERRPVNNIHRLLFASSLALENKESGAPLLTSIIHPEFRAFSTGYTDSIVTALPGLKTIIQAVSGNSGILEPGLTKDLLFLWKCYTRFLDEYALFEPEYEEFSFTVLKSKAFLFYPEIIQDYTRFQTQLENSPEVVPVSETHSGCNYILFDNPLQEVKHLLASIEQLLQSGVSADSIGITIADKETFSILLDEAALRGIPLSVRQGDPLSDYPAGRFFFLLKEIAASDYSFSSLKNLLMNSCYPWKDASMGADFIAFGVRQFCMKGKREWEKRVTAYGSSLLSDFFTNLSRSVEGITGASSFAGVKSALFRFIHTFFNDNGWEPGDEKVFQTCINVLNEMVQTESDLPGITVHDPFPLYMKVLSSRVYVTRDRRGGVPVFPYRVSAGTGTACHFLAGASERSTRVLHSGFPYLREDQKQALELKESDSTEAFLNAYSISGEKVFFSGSREGVSDSHRVPSFFLHVEGGVSTPQDGGKAKKDLYFLETELWKGNDTGIPGSLYPLQHTGLIHASRTCLAAKGEDFTRYTMSSPGLKQSVRERQADEQTGFIQISPTRLEGFARCPFRYLSSFVLGLSSEEFDLKTEDPKQVGIIYHQIVTDLFEAIRPAGDSVDPARYTEYLKILEECIEENFRRWRDRGGLFMPPLMAYQKRKTVDLLNAFLLEEVKEFGGFQIIHCEYQLVLPVEEKSVSLTGRIDRISRDEDGYLLLDYKKRNRVKKKDLLGEPQISFQMPFYTMLAAGSGMDIAHVSYYDFEKKGYDHVLRSETKKSWTDGEGMNSLTERTLNKVHEMAEAVREGSFRCTTDSERCSPCEYRTICRERYVLD